MVKGEVRQVEGGTGKASVNATNARERAKAGTDNYSSPQNLGNSHVKILVMFAKGGEKENGGFVLLKTH